MTPVLTHECLFDSDPFPHLLIEKLLSDQTEVELLRWLESVSFWKIIKTEFYEQYEFSLLDFSPPDDLTELTSNRWISELESLFDTYFNVPQLNLVDITAHKHVSG